MYLIAIIQTGKGPSVILLILFVSGKVQSKEEMTKADCYFASQAQNEFCDLNDKKTIQQDT